ncbi:MAG: S8 family serine peptidase [bacterium]|nr:S8 family serine peptidase [bacterium]
MVENLNAVGPVLSVLDGSVFFLGAGLSPDDLRIDASTNVDAADTTNTDQLQPGGSSGLNLTGAGYTVGVWEAEGLVRATHQELAGRVQVIDSGSANNHATHVAGTIAAAGVNPDALGMASGVAIRSRNATNDANELAADASLIQVSNHSYSFITGWAVRSTASLGLSIGTADIWWEDRTLSSIEDANFGQYGFWSRDLDEVLYDNPNLLSVWSAGNDRNDLFTDYRGDNTYVTYLSVDPGNVSGYQGEGWYLVPNSGLTSAPASDGNGGTGYDSIPNSEQTAKNNLTVGAVHDVLDDPITGVSLTSFSSFGPVDDGRIKPDVVGNGASLYSSIASSDSDYGNLSGTSMAAPNVSGSAVLLVEHYEDLYARLPPSATTKGAIIHTALDIGSTGPDYSSGWGLMDTAAAADFLSQSAVNGNSDLLIEDQYSGNEWTLQFNAGGVPLKATIVWTDPESMVLSDGLDDSTSMLVNDLDLWITDSSGNVYYPWTLDPANPSAPAVRTTTNHVDNVEQVLIDAPSSDSYTVHINAAGSVLNQTFSLLISGAEATNAGNNDNFSDRIDLGSTRAVSVSGNNVGYSGESGELPQNGDITSAWWKWTAPTNGTLTVDTFGSGFDTFLTLATGSSVEALTLVAQNDDGGSGLQSVISTPVAAGTEYQIAVDGFQDETGDISLNLGFIEDIDNDSFADRIDLGSVSSGSYNGNNMGYTGETGEPEQNGDITSAWWSWTAPSNGTLTVDTFGSGFDTFLTLATGSTVDALSLVAQNDDGGSGLQSVITSPVLAGIEYQIAVDGFQSETGAITLNLSFSQAGENLTVALPSPSGGNNIVIRKADGDLEIFDLNANTAIFSAPLSTVNSLQVIGSSSVVDQIFLDYASGGFFHLAGGIELTGGSNQGDKMLVTGTGTTQAAYSFVPTPVAQTQLQVAEGSLSYPVGYEGFEIFDWNGLASFQTSSTLNLGSSLLTIGALASVQLSNDLSLAGGRLESTSGLIVPSGVSVHGFGQVSTPNDPTKPILNGGSIAGTSSTQLLELSGQVFGSGSLDFVLLAGTYSPGSSSAIVENGSVRYAEGSTTVIEIGGAHPGSGGYDQINHSGDITISDAAHEMRFSESFTPAYGDTFTVASWLGTRSGEFTGWNGELMNSSVAVIPRYDANQLNLITTGPGDANLDGQVSFADFLILQNGFGGVGDWKQGDFNLDGTVTFADFLILQNAFGQVYFG